jgi:hypothetical protein
LSRPPSNANCSTTIPGAELAAQARHGLGDHAEVLRDHRQRAELVLDRAEELRAGPAPPAAVLRGLVALRHGPVRDEAAEVVDARQVDEVERAPKRSIHQR